MMQALKQEKQNPTLPGFILDDRSMSIKAGFFERTMPLIGLPDKALDWLIQGRKAMFSVLEGKESNLGFFAQHLPVIATWSENELFPFNLGNKGVGLLPKQEHLEGLIERYEKILADTKGKHWKESLKARCDVVAEFYDDKDKIDNRCLATLEIFERQSFTNLCQRPMASLLFTGNSPSYYSIQINAGVEVIPPSDLRHRFIKLSRILFEYDGFHIAQDEFPYAYIFWCSEVKEKTPFHVGNKNKVAHMPKLGNLAWDEAAINAVNQAPSMVQGFIREKLEEYANQRGFERITMELVSEARTSFRK